MLPRAPQPCLGGQACRGWRSTACERSALSQGRGVLQEADLSPEKTRTVSLLHHRYAHVENREVLGGLRCTNKLVVCPRVSSGKTRSLRVRSTSSPGCSMARKPVMTANAHLNQPQSKATLTAALTAAAGSTALQEPGSALCHFLSICQAAVRKFRYCGNLS